MSADQINELKDQLRTADKMAQEGDEQAKVDAQKIYDRIQQLSASQTTPDTRTEEEKKYATQELPAEITGAIGAGIGKYGTYGYGGYKGYKLLKELGAIDEIKDVGINAINKYTGSNIPTTVEKFHVPQMVTEHGFGPGAMRNTAHNVDQAVANALHAELKTNPVPGYELTGNSRVLTQPGTYPTPQGGPSVTVSGAPNMPPEPPMSKMATGAKNILGTASKLYNPAMRVLGPVAGGWQAGYEGAEAYNRLNRGDTLGGILSLIGSGSGLASMYPPAAPIAFPISLGASGLGWTLDEYRKRHGKPQTDNAEHAPQYANGGLVYLAEGRQPDPIPIQKNNPMVEQAANKALIEIAKRKALYEIGQIAEQERAKQAASRARPNSLYPATGTLEPSGNGGPMLNNPLNR